MSTEQALLLLLFLVSGAYLVYQMLTGELSDE